MPVLVVFHGVGHRNPPVKVTGIRTATQTTPERSSFHSRPCRPNTTLVSAATVTTMEETSTAKCQKKERGDVFSGLAATQISHVYNPQSVTAFGEKDTVTTAR